MRVVAFYCLASLASLMSTHAATLPSYKFTTDHPPLFKVYGGRVIEVDPSTEITEIGSPYSWSTSESHLSRSRRWSAGTFPFQRWHTTNYFVSTNTKVTARRFRLWAISEKPEHISSEGDRVWTEKRGYSRTERQQLERTLALTLKASGESKVVGFSAEAAATLKLTKEEAQRWEEETTQQRTKHFAAHTWYDTWILEDVVQLDILTQSSEAPDHPEPAQGPWEPSQQSLRTILLTYEDDAPDLQSHKLTFASSSPEGLEEIRREKTALDFLIQASRSVSPFSEPVKGRCFYGKAATVVCEDLTQSDCDGKSNSTWEEGECP